MRDTYEANATWSRARRSDTAGGGRAAQRCVARRLYSSVTRKEAEYGTGVRPI